MSPSTITSSQSQSSSSNPQIPQLSSSTLSNLSVEPLLVLLSAHGRTDMLLTLIRKLNTLPTTLIPHPSSSVSIQTTPLHISVQYAKVDCVRALLSNNFPPNILDSHSNYPLSYANTTIRHIFTEDACARTARGDVSFLNYHLSAGLTLFDIDDPITRNTLLHWAASFGNTSSMETLLNHLSDLTNLDIPNGKGITPLADAAISAHPDIIYQLIAAGANPHITIPPNHTPLTELKTLREDIRTILLNAIEDQKQDSTQPSLSPSEITSDPTLQHPISLPSEPATPAVSSGALPSYTPSPTFPISTRRTRTIWPPPALSTTSATTTLTLPPVVTLSADAACMPIARKLSSWVADSPHFSQTQIRIRVVGGGTGGETNPLGFAANMFMRIDHRQMPTPQGYRIAVRRTGVYIVAADKQGALYAAGSLFALLERAADDNELETNNDPEDTPLVLQACSIVDKPKLEKRGLQIRIDGKRVWKIETVKRVLKFCAVRLKLNQLYLCMGNVLERVVDENSNNGTGTSQMKWTPEQVLELVEFCHEYFIELIPVIDVPPNMESNDDVRQMDILFEETLPLFASEQVHVGQLGKENQVLQKDFDSLQQLATLLRSRGSPTMLISAADILLSLQDEVSANGVIAELPACVVPILDVVDRDESTFQQGCSLLRQHGLPFYTCVESHLPYSFTGRLTTVIQKQESAINAAVEEGAIGVILKDDCSSNFGAPLVSLLQTLIPFAGKAWNPSASMLTADESEGRPNKQFIDVCDMYLFHDVPKKAMLGKIAKDLGDIHKLAGDISGNAIFGQITASSSSGESYPISKLNYPELRHAARKAEKIEYALSTYDGNADPYDVLEMRMSAMFFSVAARMCATLLWFRSAASAKVGQRNSATPLTLASLPDGRRSDFCNTCLEGIDLFRITWMHRYHPYGFTESVEAILGQTLTELARDMPYQQYLEDRKAEGWIPSD